MNLDGGFLLGYLLCQGEIPIGPEVSSGNILDRPETGGGTIDGDVGDPVYQA
jgi:hypothetical protein